MIGGKLVRGILVACVAVFPLAAQAKVVFCHQADDISHRPYALSWDIDTGVSKLTRFEHGAVIYGQVQKRGATGSGERFVNLKFIDQTNPEMSVERNYRVQELQGYGPNTYSLIAAHSLVDKGVPVLLDITPLVHMRCM